MHAPKTRRPALVDTLRALVSIDARSLAALRIGLGVIILVDLALRVPDLVAHYTDAGVWPRATWLKLIPSEWVMSLNVLGGTAFSQGLLFTLTALAAVALLVGWRTRLATVAVFVLVLSLHYRNTMILNAGDRILRLMLFWCLFLPLGAVWSFDRRASGERGPARISGVAPAALLLSIAAIYVVTSAMKNGPDWIKDGNAVYYVLNIDMTVTTIGKWLGQFPALLRPMTFGVLAFEWIGPWLLFLPLAWPWPRLFALAGFLAMHAGFGLCLNLGVFPWIDAISFLPFVPREAWDWLGTTAVRPVARLRGICMQIACMLDGVALAVTPAPATRRGFSWPLAAAGVATAFFALIQSFNVASFKPEWVPSELASLQYAFGLEQGWGMFAPTPQKGDGWYFIPGKLEDGTDYDVFNDVAHPASAAKPDYVAETYINARWRSYLLNMYQFAREDHLQAFGAYLCRRSNAHLAAGGKRLESFDVHFIEEVTPPPGQAAVVRDINVWGHRCFPKAPPPLDVATPGRPADAPKARFF